MTDPEHRTPERDPDAPRTATDRPVTDRPATDRPVTDRPVERGVRWGVIFAWIVAIIVAIYIISIIVGNLDGRDVTDTQVPQQQLAHVIHVGLNPHGPGA